MGFTFKQFHINDDRCAMKVGTDAVLLGAMADISQASSILDMGCGSGVIALMLAQRTQKEVKISAVEIDQAAFWQAEENVQQSPWADKIQCFHQDVEDFCQKCGEKNERFDLIVANPPYFPPGIHCGNEARNLARYQLQSHLDWLEAATNCLIDEGKIQFILPFDAAESLIKQTALFCVERCEIITKQGKPAQRMLVGFSPLSQRLQQSTLIIYNQNNQYTDAFKQLTHPFYLHF
ncbi:MAG: tRNA1(Val) (adenine(37)-N6)-methyltransferase [Lonepinella koalarum]|nr:tRNA1(Val) (adenine(37)-N6)-methyltransferase [Lonepinella koalarum]